MTSEKQTSSLLYLGHFQIICFLFHSNYDADLVMLDDRGMEDGFVDVVDAINP